MLTWFLVNVLLSLLALAFIALNDTAPHRLRFLAGFAALAAWLVPWSLLPDLLPANVFSMELERIEGVVDANRMRLTGVEPGIVGTIAEQTPGFIVVSVLELGFAALTLIGCLLFAWKAAAHRLLLRHLERTGGDGNWLWAQAGLAPVCPLVVQREVPGAFVSGLLRPRIWVHGDLAFSRQLATLLRHETTHIRQHDNCYLLAITFVECMLWWNPLARYLGRTTRELQELSCDEACQRSSADYPAELAQLMIDSARGGQQPRMLAFGANICNDPNPNLRRIQLLQRSYPMLKKHMFAAALTAASALLSVGFVTAQPDAEAAAGARSLGIADARFLGAEEEQLRFARSRNSEGAVVRVELINGEPMISMSFTKARLLGVLMPLVPFVSPGSRPSYRGVAVVRGLDGEPETTSELTTAELIESMEAAGGAASWNEKWQVVSFSPRAVPNDTLVMEYPEASNRIVSVTLNQATIDEAIAAIAEASGCNIFQDADTIVVDYCDE